MFDLNITNVMHNSQSHTQLQPVGKRVLKLQPSASKGLGQSEFRSMMFKYNKLMSEIKAGKNRLQDSEDE